MNIVLDQIMDRLAAAEQQPDFLDILFGTHRQSVLSGTPLVLFGAGSLGQELCVALNNHGVRPVAFCDSDPSKKGTVLCGIPVITIDELNQNHKNSLVLIATKKHSTSVRDFLRDNGFEDEMLLCKDPDVQVNVAFLYAVSITQLFIAGIKQQYCQGSIVEKLKRDEHELIDAYNLLADQKSRDLFVSKLAFLASKGNIGLLAVSRG